MAYAAQGISEDARAKCLAAGGSASQCDALARQVFEDFILGLSPDPAVVVDVILDFTPVIGDVKGVYECIADPSVVSCGGAAVGVVPLAGDAVKIVLKNGDKAVAVIKRADGTLEKTTVSADDLAKVETGNRPVPDSWHPVSGAGAQVNTPRGFTSYRTPDGDIVHVSPGGLKYGSDPKFGNRVDHVLDHTAPNPSKPTHTVFNAQGDDALEIVDEAWLRKGTPDPKDPRAYVVDLGRPIGTQGETKVRIIVNAKSTDEITTAYPVP